MTPQKRNNFFETKRKPNKISLVSQFPTKDGEFPIAENIIARQVPPKTIDRIYADEPAEFPMIMMMMKDADRTTGY